MLRCRRLALDRWLVASFAILTISTFLFLFLLRIGLSIVNYFPLLTSYVHKLLRDQDHQLLASSFVHAWILRPAGTCQADARRRADMSVRQQAQPKPAGTLPPSPRLGRRFSDRAQTNGADRDASAERDGGAHDIEPEPKRRGFLRHFAVDLPYEERVRNLQH
jgi:hypothetical protein